MKDKDSLSDLFAAARHALPHGQASSFGFETRLRAGMEEASDSLFDWIALFSWRVSFACLPLAVGIIAILAFYSQGTLPDGMGSFVANWAGLLPI